MSKEPEKLSVSTMMVEAKRLAILGSLLDTYSETSDREALVSSLRRAGMLGDDHARLLLAKPAAEA